MELLIVVLIVVLILALAVYAVRMLLPQVGIGEPFTTIVIVLLVLIAIVYIAQRAGIF